MKNFDDDFLEFINGLPPLFIMELYIAWKMDIDLNTSIRMIDIDSIYKKNPKPITDAEIKHFYRGIKSGKISLRDII